MVLDFKSALPKKVEMLELLLRDGLQHVERAISTEAKLWYAEYFIRAGFKKIEVTNFGHPRLLVQSRDAEAILEAVHKLKIVKEEKPHLKCYGMTQRPLNGLRIWLRRDIRLAVWRLPFPLKIFTAAAMQDEPGKSIKRKFRNL